MKTILFMTMSDELNKQEDKTAIKELLESIRKTKITHAIFFMPKTSTIQIENMYSYYKKNLKDEFKFFIVKIKNKDNIIEIKNKMQKSLKINNKYNAKADLILNYTYGTRAMIVALTLLSVKTKTPATKNIEPNDISTSISNKAVENQVKIITQKGIIEIIKLYFNEYKFIDALLLLEKIPDCPYYKNYKILLETFNMLDKFHHIKLPANIEPEKIGLGIEENFEVYLENSKIITDNTHPLYEIYMIADLIANSKRRSNEKRFNDAIARLYRTLEIIKTTQLKKHGIDINKADMADFKDLHIRGLNESNMKTLYMGYKILEKLEDPVGKYYTENQNKFNGILESRHNSILAHGFQSKTQEEYDLFYNEIVNLAKCMYGDIEQILKRLEFPQFNRVEEILV